MDDYTPHLYQQVRGTIGWFHRWAGERRKWWVLPVRSSIKLSSVENQTQLWNTVHLMRRDDPRETRISELLPRRTWRSNQSNLRDPNHWVHHGKHHDHGWYMWQHKGSHTSFDIPRISNNAMETRRPYFRGWTDKTQFKKKKLNFFAGTIWCSLHLNNILLFDFIFPPEVPQC